MLPETFSASLRKVLNFYRKIGISFNKLPKVEITYDKEKPHSWGMCDWRNKKVAINLHFDDLRAFEITLTHELFHCWLHEKGIIIPKELEEVIATFLHTAYARINYNTTVTIVNEEPLKYKIGKLFANELPGEKLLDIAKVLVNYVSNCKSDKSSC